MKSSLDFAANRLGALPCPFIYVYVCKRIGKEDDV